MAAKAKEYKVYPVEIGYFITALQNIGGYVKGFSFNGAVPFNGGMTVHLKHGVSMSSWGESIRVTLYNQGGQTGVEVYSECDMPTQIIDWGKNSENVRNVFYFLEQGMSAMHFGQQPQYQQAQTQYQQTQPQYQQVQPQYQQTQPQYQQAQYQQVQPQYQQAQPQYQQAQPQYQQAQPQYQQVQPQYQQAQPQYQQAQPQYQQAQPQYQQAQPQYQQAQPQYQQQEPDVNSVGHPQDNGTQQ